MEFNASDMPREKLIKNGPKSLADYELLAIMLGSGTKTLNVIDLSKKLVNEYGLNRLLKMNYHELKNINGIKEAKATKLMATFELARRVIEYENRKDLITLKSASEVYNYIISDYLLLTHEKLCVLFLDSKLSLIEKKFYDGDVVVTELPIKKIIKESIYLDAYGIILIHNHPSGNVEPSMSDIESTAALNKVLSKINVILFDHLVIANNDKYYSFNENRLDFRNEL